MTENPYTALRSRRGTVVHLARPSRRTLCGVAAPSSWRDAEGAPTCGACSSAYDRLTGQDTADDFGRFYNRGEAS